MDKGRTDSPVRSVQHCPAVHQKEFLLQISVELHPGPTLILLPLNRPNTNVLMERKTKKSHQVRVSSAREIII